MAWTAPRTWVVGEIVTAAQLNAHLRDNLLDIGPHFRLYKTADESVTSSIAPQDDDHLFFAIGQNERWAIEMWLHVTSGGGGDLKVQWDVGPTGGTTRLSAHPHVNDVETILFLAPTVEGGALNLTQGSSQAMVHLLKGWASTTNTGQTFRLKWAQVNSDAAAVTLKLGSYLIAHRLLPA